MIKRYLIIPDVHLTTKRPHTAYSKVCDFIADFKPDEIILLGDFMNLDSLSHWNEHRRLEMEGRRYRKEIEAGNRELDYLQKFTKSLVYIEGNHENWISQYIEKHPEVAGLIELPTMLEFNKRKVKWVPQDKLYKVGKLYFLHGFYTGIHHAKAHLLRYGCCICYGHTHSAQTYQLTMKMQEPIMAWGLGCLCGHSPSYMKGKPGNWINQFGIMFLNEKTGKFTLCPVNIVYNKFIWEEKEY